MYSKLTEVVIFTSQNLQHQTSSKHNTPVATPKYDIRVTAKKI